MVRRASSSQARKNPHARGPEWQAGRASLTPTDAALLVLLSWPVVGHEVLFQTFREGKRQGGRTVKCRSVNTGAEPLLGHYSLNNLGQVT